MAALFRQKDKKRVNELKRLNERLIAAAAAGFDGCSERRSR